MTMLPAIDRTVFLDTSYIIALANPKDNHHEAAAEISDRLTKSGTEIVTTYGIVLEIGNALSKVSYRPTANSIISSLMADSSVSIVPVSINLFAQAFELFERRPDKDWGLTDCCSFVIMQDQHIRQALTADLHFIQAGFKALLLDS